MVLTKEVEVLITEKNKEMLKEHGYNVFDTKKIMVKLEDLTDCCSALIEIKCDSCGKLFKRSWDSYNRNRSIQNDYCEECKKIFKKEFGGHSFNYTSMIPYEKISDFYSSCGCKLLLSKNDYYGKNTIADYICKCGRVQYGRSIDYFKRVNQLCEECSKEKKRRDRAFRLGNDYESVKNKLSMSNKELLTNIEYFTKNDEISYLCKNCNTVNTIKYYTFTSKEHMCKGCRSINDRLKRWENNLALAESYDLEVLSTFDDFVDNDSYITLRCKCGKPFITIVNEFRNANKVQCNECGLKLRSGENCLLWKGGITPETEKIRNSKEYVDWRNIVLERDGFTCQCCGDNSGGNLCVHHIENFSDNVSLRFDPSNGITMCNECHNPSVIGSFHHVYGTHFNNQEQLQQYFNDKRRLLGLDYVDINDIINNVKFIDMDYIYNKRRRMA